MTDRYAGFVVTLEKNLREDDAQQIITALKQIRGVIDVRPINGDPMFTAAEGRARGEMQQLFHEFYRKMFE